MRNFSVPAVSDTDATIVGTSKEGNELYEQSTY